MCCDSELICKGSRWSLFPPDIIYRYIFINLMFSPCPLNNKPQIITRYSTWQPSHVTYRLLPLTVALNSSHQAHTPQGNSRSTLSIIIQVSDFGTIPYKFDSPFHITVQISSCQTPTTHIKHHN